MIVLVLLLWRLRWARAWPLGLTVTGLSALAWIAVPRPDPGPTYWDIMIFFYLIAAIGIISAASMMLRGVWLWWHARN